MEPSTELPPRWERGGQLRGRRGWVGLAAAFGRAGSAAPRRRRTRVVGPARCPRGRDIISNVVRGPRPQQQQGRPSADTHGAASEPVLPLRGGGRSAPSRSGSHGWVLLRTNHTGSDRLLPSPPSPRAWDSRAETTPAAGWRPRLRCPALGLPPRQAGVACPRPRVPPRSGAPSVLLSPSLETREGVQPAPSYSHRQWLLPGPVYLGFVTQVARTSVC